MQDNSHEFLSCPHCGAQNTSAVEHCVSCGEKIPTHLIHPVSVISSSNTETIESPPSAFMLPAIDARAILNLMPILRYLARGAQDELKNAFADFHFIFILHFLSDLLGFIEAFRMLGLSWERAHFLYKDYRYPFRERIAGQLEANRADVFRLMEGEPLLRFVGNIIELSRVEGKKIIVVEDGGYVVPLIHQHFADDLKWFQGAVEQTTKGINEVNKVLPLKIPMLSVATAKVKREKESPEIARAVWRNIQRLLFDRDLRTPKILVIGYGSVGARLANHLADNHADVRVYDISEDKRQQAAKDGYKTADSLVQLIETEPGLIVIGATGQTSIGRHEIEAMQHTSVLVSASSDQREIGLRFLRRASFDPTPLRHPISGHKSGDVYRLASTQNEITLLAEGYPVNFWDDESMPFRISQVALVPLFLSAIAIATQSSQISVGTPDSTFVDTLIEEADVYNDL